MKEITVQSKSRPESAGRSRRRIYISVSALVLAILFFGCSRKPGEKLYQEAMAEWDKGHLVRARALLEKSIRRRAGSLENAGAYNQLGMLLFESGNAVGAVDAFTESSRIDPAEYDVLCNLGIALSAKDDLAEAERVFREASLMRPDDARPLAFAGAVYLRNQKWADAERNLRRALQRTPTDPRLQNALALAELHSGNANNALKRLQTAAQQNPDYAPLIFNIAVIQQKWLNKPADAKNEFERFLSKTPANDRYAAVARAQIEAITGKPVTLPQSGAGDRAAAEKLFQSALADHKAGKLNDAAKKYLQSVEKDSSYEQAFYNLGLVYYAQNKTAQAAEAFERAVQLNPAFTAARYNSALAQYRLGNRAVALREVNELLSTHPDYQPAVDLKALIQK